MTKESTPINIDLIDQLLKDYKSPEDVLGENGLLKQFTKASSLLRSPSRFYSCRDRAESH